ncbi:MAG TPA: hypothetical protein VH087_06340 [Thermoanaerobaculia bacterium]|nr:hypothetical protein [Thermoanaerobaculia bacterium]
MAALVAAQIQSANAPATFVPWKVLNLGDAPAKGELVLNWIPATRDEIRHSPLITSRSLALSASQCVAMQIVRPEDSETIEKLAADELPAAILVDGDGKVVARVKSEAGALRTQDVEKMVRDALANRDIELDHVLDSAKTKADAGEREAAVDLYRRVCAMRCLFPRKARDAERALSKLGVAVK